VTTSSSRRGAPGAAGGDRAAPAGERGAPSYTRFIPREELQGFAAWTPDALGDAAGAPAAETPAAAESLHAQLHAARQAGYQDGYRDGLVALDGFKRSFATQVTAQVGALLQRFDAELAALDGEIAQALARTAVELARQVVRSELAVRPELVARVAADALDAVLHSARHLRVHVHPDDLPLVEHGAAEALRARGARLLASAEVERGGCTIDSDVGRVDAAIATRWAQAALAFGHDAPWHEAPPAEGPP
jgi:flagellar assembly protein FliH